MARNSDSKNGKTGNKFPTIFLSVVLVVSVLTFLSTIFPVRQFNSQYEMGHEANKIEEAVAKVKDTLMGAAALPVDRSLYDEKMMALANNPPASLAATSTGTTTIAATTTPNYLWPVKSNVYPLSGAILPFSRIVAYYGNFYSKNMGVLGQYPPDQVVSMLNDTVQKWQAADPSTPVLPAIQYVAVTAQGSPGPDGKYRLRMPEDQIEKALSLAEQVNGILILDIQVGQSDVEMEVPLLEKYLKMPNVELAIDPEFSMKNGKVPGSVIGTMDATDVNFAADYLAKLVDDNNLPPKVLIVHRFTEKMVTNTQNIKLLPEVQIVMDMDGWGPQANKLATYREVIYPYPVQFTGFKIFYKNDILSASSTLLQPINLLNLRPIPIYIQYQ